jgi:hypothetical protein
MSASHRTVAITALEKKDFSAEHLEVVSVQEHNLDYLARYPLIANKSTEELRKIEKGLLRKLDWIFLPVVCGLAKSQARMISDRCS